MTAETFVAGIVLVLALAFVGGIALALAFVGGIALALFSKE